MVAFLCCCWIGSSSHPPPLPPAGHTEKRKDKRVKEKIIIIAVAADSWEEGGGAMTSNASKKSVVVFYYSCSIVGQVGYWDLNPGSQHLSVLSPRYTYNLYEKGNYSTDLILNYSQSVKYYLYCAGYRGLTTLLLLRVLSQENWTHSFKCCGSLDGEGWLIGWWWVYLIRLWRMAHKLWWIARYGWIISLWMMAH